MDFEWDGAKAAANRRKHAVSFDEAASVFDDPLVCIFHDKVHSVVEDRWIAIGISGRGRLLVVSHAYRGHRTRIISARKATANEVREYEER
ncbi:MAG TPA: BrnT family toxin [Candidatus Methylomirabilis sp.]|nr:BrnT family toxin [Candidatus Methylomirabilis sp.]